MRDINAVDLKKSAAPVRDGGSTPVYRRPAGMYSSVLCLDNSDGYSGFYDGYGFCLMAKPYADYTWTVVPDGTSGVNYAWNFSINGDTHYVDYQPQVTFNTAFSADQVPILYAVNGRLDDDNAQWTPYQIKSNMWNWNSTDNTYVLTSETPASIVSAENNARATKLIFPDWDDADVIPLYSSKTMKAPDKNNPYIFTTYHGAKPWGDNEMGWWFGKNASHVDGMGQAFEKPEHPYQLYNVVMMINTSLLVVNRDVTMTCKIYRLNEIPEYDEMESVTLPETPGELIAKGRYRFTPDFVDYDNDIIAFNLYDVNSGSVIRPTIDFPILVCVDGYNDEGMEDLVDFTTFISSNNQADEGYGELAYLKYGLFDDEGDFTGEYKWFGINNFFSSGSMKTGFAIFISTSNNYITFQNKAEHGEHLFPSTGGVLTKTWADGSTNTGIKFLSSLGATSWSMTCDGSANLPSWLTVNLSNAGGSNGSLGVVANVYASPLPSGVNYREAIIRFEIPGDYIEYKFMQGEKPALLKGDVNGDHKVSINDVTALINMLLSGSTVMNESTDVNSDGRITIGDVTELIHNLLSGKVETIAPFENKTFTVNGVSFNMIAVEGGTFAMGATRDQGNNARFNEKPVHLVTLSDYLIGETEVTQALWLAVMGSNPSQFSDNLNRPVEMVSWNDCQTFISRLNELTGMNFRLPTEAEWEFAARGGNKSIGNMYAGSNNYDDVAWYDNNASSTTHPVATKAPNELGIYDMSGNIYEYCMDFSDGFANYSADPETDPTGPATGSSRIIRGGSMSYDYDLCRCAYRWQDSPTSVWSDQGLRLVLPTK